MEEHPDSSSFMNASVPSNSVRMMVDSFRWCWWTDRGMNAGSCFCWRGLSDSCGSETQWDISGPPCTRLSGQDTIVTNKWCMARAWGLALTLSRLCFNSQLLQLASHWGRKRRVIVNGRTTHFRPPLSPLLLAWPPFPSHSVNLILLKTPDGILATLIFRLASRQTDSGCH